MACLSWPQKKVLKMAFKLIEKKIDGNNQINQQAPAYLQGNQMPMQNSQGQVSNNG